MKHGYIYWFTGLSGSGKTTISNEIKKLLNKDGYSVLIIDGDIVRNQMHKNLTFSLEDIKMNNDLILNLCLKERKFYDFVLVSIISPYKSSRERARKKSASKFYEVYCKADMEVLIKRDTKGLYAKAIKGKIKNLIGFSPKTKYEPPDNPDIIIDSTNNTIEESTHKLIGFVKDNLDKASINNV